MPSVKDIRGSYFEIRTYIQRTGIERLYDPTIRDETIAVGGNA